jgi:hypothetical protein
MSNNKLDIGTKIVYMNAACQNQTVNFTVTLTFKDAKVPESINTSLDTEVVEETAENITAQAIPANGENAE